MGVLEREHDRQPGAEPVDEPEEAALHVLHEGRLVERRLGEPQGEPEPAATRSVSVGSQHPSTSSRRRCMTCSGGSSSSIDASWRTIAATGAKLALPAGTWA